MRRPVELRHLGPWLVLVAAVYVLAASWWDRTGVVDVVPVPWPDRLCAGGIRTVDAWVVAGPGVALDPDAGDRLSHRTFDARGAVRDGPRSPVPALDGPMRPVRTKLRIEAPPEPGTVRLLPAAVREQVRWYPTRVRPRAVSVGPPEGAFRLGAPLPDASGPAGAPAAPRRARGG